MFLRKIENTYRKNGARIQELFDLRLFNLPWNNIVAGEKPDNEEVFLYSKKYKLKNSLEDLKDWYPKDVGRLNLLPAVAVCQRVNVWWDISLRKNLFWSIIFVIFVLTFIIFIVLSKDSENLFLFIFSLLPLYETLISYAKSQFLSIKKNKELKKSLNSLLCDMTNEIDNDSLKNDLRIIQDEIFRHRESCFFVPNWFYKIFRKNQEAQTSYSTRDYVNKILSKKLNRQ